eukprot:scaffold97667_cov34-Prasinocladus_malaysianus.AAC.1
MDQGKNVLAIEALEGAVFLEKINYVVSGAILVAYWAEYGREEHPPQGHVRGGGPGPGAARATFYCQIIDSNHLLFSMAIKRFCTAMLRCARMLRAIESSMIIRRHYLYHTSVISRYN